MALSRLSRALSICSRITEESTVQSTSPFLTVLPISLSKPLTEPLPAAYTVAEAGRLMAALP